MKVKLTETIQEVRNSNKSYNTTETKVRFIDFNEYQNYINTINLYQLSGFKIKAKNKTNFVLRTEDKQTKITYNFLFL